MLNEVEEIWKEEWAAKGQDPPTEQRLEDTYVAAEAEEEQTDGGEKAFEENLESSEAQTEEKWSVELSLRTKEGQGEGQGEGEMQE